MTESTAGRVRSDAARAADLRRRFALLGTDARALGQAVASHENALHAARTRYVEARVANELGSTPLEALRAAGASGLRLAPLHDAGFRYVGQLIGRTTEQLAAYRGIGAASAAKVIGAAISLRASVWAAEWDALDPLLKDVDAANVRRAAASVEAARLTHARFGHLVPELQHLALEGAKAATMASRSLAGARRRQQALVALAAAEAVLIALEDEGVSGWLAAIVRPQPGAHEEVKTVDSLRQALGPSSVAVEPVPGPQALASWVEAHRRGDVPRVRVTHPGIGVAAAAAGVTIFAMVAAAAASSPPSETEAQSLTAQAASPTSSPPTPTPTPTPTITPTESFSLDDEREQNGTWELSRREAWSGRYADLTAAEPVSAANVSLGEASTVEVEYVIDGDTFITSDGDRVRVIGIDSPEFGACGYDLATALAEELLEGQSVTATEVGGEPAEDRYGRILRYVTLGDGRDYGLVAIEAGFASARYDGYDGYSPHPQQDTYHSADDATAHVCGDENPPRSYVPAVAVPEPAPAPAPAPVAALPEANEPWNQPGPDLDCKDIGHPVIVYSPDYHDLDRDKDGVGCESY